MNLGKTFRVFLDTEFTDFVNIDLISIGLVASDGSEFYGENLDFDKSLSSFWVKDNIYPLLNASKYGMKRSELSARLWQWFDDLPCEFVIITIDYQTDYELMLDLFGDEKHPKIIGVQLINQNIYSSIDRQISHMHGSDADYQVTVKRVVAEFQNHMLDYFFTTKQPRHHALADAQANKIAYSKIATDFGIQY